MSYRCDFCKVQQPEGKKPERCPKIRLIITEITERGNFEKKSLIVRSEGREEVVEPRLACHSCVQKGARSEVVEVIFGLKALEGSDKPKETLVLSEAKT